jgi:hypothetical protein
MMTKRDFVALADTLKGLEFDTATARQAALDIVADALVARYPEFNRDVWVRYSLGECGPNGGALRQGRRQRHPQRWNHLEP